MCAFGALAGFLFLNTLYLQDVRGLAPLHAGLFTLPMAAMTVVFAPLSGRLVGAAGRGCRCCSPAPRMCLGALPLTRLTRPLR